MMETPDNVTAGMGYAIRHIRAVSLEDYLAQLDAAYRTEMGEDLEDKVWNWLQQAKVQLKNPWEA